MGLAYGEEKLQEGLEKTASRLVEEGRGVLCADETIRSFSLMFRPLGLENNKETRRRYREVLLTTPRLGKYISGVLLSEEALGQRADRGHTFPELLAQAGVLTGLTLDYGFVRIPYTEDEWTAEGLDGLQERCRELYSSGCRFVRWRSSYTVDPGHRPTTQAFQTNLMATARYASIAQDSRLVPIVEVSLSTCQASYPLERSVRVLKDLLAGLFYYLHMYKVHLPGTLLRVSMASPGEECRVGYADRDLAQTTLLVLQKAVPPAVAGILFSSGNQPMEEVTALLDHVNALPGRKPWPLSFCFGRPLQAIVLLTWLGLEGRREASQGELLRRAKENSLASRGRYLQERAALRAAYQHHHERPGDCPQHHH